MRRIRYVVATSLDGYIAGPQGEADWIVSDPDIDFGAIFAQFDTFLIGRRTYETMARGGMGHTKGVKTFVFSRTLRPEDCPGATLVADKVEETLTALRAQPGKDVWVFGGGSLFRSLLDARLVDTVEVAIIPVILGGGIPLVETPAKRTGLKLTGHHVYGTGIVSLEYDVRKESAGKGATGRTASGRKREPRRPEP